MSDSEASLKDDIARLKKRIQYLETIVLRLEGENKWMGSLTHSPAGVLWRDTALARLEIMREYRERIEELKKREHRERIEELKKLLIDAGVPITYRLGGEK